eukprot:m.201671 g.201671  ORF g.201671 m.201671 type:complete len:270 (+) comp18424_c0_seq7:1509-2318(+)
MLQWRLYRCDVEPFEWVCVSAGRVCVFAEKSPTLRPGTKLWCTVSLEDNPDEDNLNKASRGTNVTHEVDIEIVKAGVGGSIGVLFSTAKNECRVEAVIDGQPASGTSLRAGDLISKIDGKKVSNVKTASKLIKAARGRVVLTAVRQETAEPTDEQASAADESGGPDAAHPGGRPERVVRTKAVMESARIFWKEKFSFAVSSVDSTLFLRFYEQRLNKWEKTLFILFYVPGVFTNCSLPTVQHAASTWPAWLALCPADARSHNWCLFVFV